MFVGVKKKKKKKKTSVVEEFFLRDISFTNFYSILRQQLHTFYTHNPYTLSCYAENVTQCQKSELF